MILNVDGFTGVVVPPKMLKFIGLNEFFLQRLWKRFEFLSKDVFKLMGLGGKDV
jgi:hypothetical protein